MYLINWLEPIITSLNKFKISEEGRLELPHALRHERFSRPCQYQLWFIPPMVIHKNKTIFVFIFHPIQNISDYTYILSDNHRLICTHSINFFVLALRLLLVVYL